MYIVMVAELVEVGLVRNRSWFYPCVKQLVVVIDREFVTCAKKISANFNEFSKIKKITKNLYKNSLNARV